MPTIRVVPEIPADTAPKVSVIVTAYNHERYLAQCLESVLAQETTFPFEIVVGEDCSTDSTRELLVTFFERYPDVIRMVLPEKNLGPNQMYLEVIRAARGDYFALLDGDDYWISTDKLERQVLFLDENEDYQVCFHDATVIQEDGDGEPRPGIPELGRDTFELEDILMGDFIPTVSVMHRRVDVDNLPDGFLEFEWADWLMLVSCAERGSLRYLPDLESGYRVHDTGLWSSRSRESQIIEEIRVYEHLKRLVPGHRDALQSGLRRCQVQLAVERAGLRHDRPVAVLRDPSVLPFYLNGRAVWHLHIGTDRSTEGVLQSLGRIRRLGGDAPSTPHWLTETPARSSDSQSVYCIVEAPKQWFERLPGLEAHLERFTRLLADESCAIYELPGQNVTERRIVAVRLEDPLPSRLRGRHIDSPRPGTATTDATFDLIGWALGKEEPVVEVRLAHGGDTLARTAPIVSRPDLAVAFPEVQAAATAGFRTAVDLAEVPEAAELIVTAVVEGGYTVVLGTIETTMRPATLVSPTPLPPITSPA